MVHGKLARQIREGSADDDALIDRLHDIEGGDSASRFWERSYVYGLPSSLSVFYMYGTIQALSTVY